MIKVCREHIGEIVYIESGADVCPACWEIKRLKERLEALSNEERVEGDKEPMPD